MKSKLSHRERFLIAVKGGKPDRVPACPCLSNMVPAKRTGKPFWEITLNKNPPLWRAYLDAARHFNLDGRMIYGGLSFQYAPDVAAGMSRQMEILEKKDDAWRTRDTFKTRFGDLTEETIHQIDNPPTAVVKLIKNLPADLAAFKSLYATPTGYDATLADTMRREAGEDAVFCLTVGYPGFHGFTDLFEGGLEAATYACLDHPELFEELRRVMHENTLCKAEMMLDYGPDILYLGGSGTLTLSTPAWVRQFCLPTIQAVTRLAKQAGVPSMIHSCGKARYLVELLANETDLNCFNPLELPPMGDCDLKEIKQKFGHRLALAGNIHTTDIMMNGSPQQVDAACKQAIEDAGRDGGFILMTGDQCGRDTPEENIFAFVRAAEKYGQY
jgi:uroporphyrinogen decarboxylase